MTSESSAIADHFVLDLATLRKPFDWDAAFGGNFRSNEIEVGIGSGYFLSRHGLENPESRILGIDKEGSEVWRSADKLARHGVGNARVLRADALYFLADYVADSAIDVYHIYYSDPWPKTRHHKRRLWRPEIVPLLERTMKPGADLFLKTDVPEYFDVIQGVLGAAAYLELVEDKRIDLEPLAGDHETNFQRKAREKGHPLHWQHWRRKP